MVIVENTGAVQTLTLNRPDALNAFNNGLFDELTDRLLDARADDGVSVVVLTGAGRAFSAGLDLSEGDVLQSKAKHGFFGLMDTLIDFNKPLLLGINGLGVGIGATICGLADIVFMAESARLRCPFTSLGLVGEAASTFTFPRLMGRQAANWMLYSSAWMSAQECKTAGLVLEILPDEQLMPEIMKRAQIIAAMPLTTLIHTKELSMRPQKAQLQAAHRAEQDIYKELLKGPAHKEALAAFKEKRPPNFSR